MNANTNGGVVLRQSGDPRTGRFLQVSVSGTRYQVRAVTAGRQQLLVDRPFSPGGGGSGLLEVAVTGNTLDTSWQGRRLSRDPLPALAELTGRGIRLTVWQDRVGVSLTPVVAASNGWASGASGRGAADGRFAQWRGRPLDIAATWNDDVAAQQHLWSVKPGAEFGSWSKDLDVSVGGIFKDRGETWAAAARGDYDDRWRTSLQRLAQYRSDKPGTTYIRFAHEFNGDWFPWSVRGSEAADFREAWRRYRAVQREVFPTAQLVFCPTADTSSSLGLDWRTAFPGREQVDVLGVDYYNQYPFVTTTEQARESFLAVDRTGAPRGIERHRQWAAANGLPFAVPEWNSNSTLGDSSAFMVEMGRWFAANAGTGPGRLRYEIVFNVDADGRQVWSVWPQTRQSGAAQSYRDLW